MAPISLVLPALALLTYVSAQSQTWWQCGGLGWTGTKTCLPGVACYYINPHFSQCVPECQPESTTLPAPTATATTSIDPSATHGAVKPQVTGTQYDIVALDGWAAGIHLQKIYSSDLAVLSPYWTNTRFMANGAVRLVYQAYSASCVKYLYLNAKAADTSYKPLVFEEYGPTVDWSFSVNADGILSTPSGLTDFVTCFEPGDTRPLYLKTGSDIPEGNCTITRLGLTAPPY